MPSVTRVLATATAVSLLALGTGVAQGTPVRSFLERAHFSPSNANFANKLGDAIAVSGDTLVIGDASWRGSGAVLVYEKGAGGWSTMTEVAVLTPSDPAVYGAFGLALAIEGDTVAVGAPGAGVTALDNGAAYVFEKPAGGWVDMTETARFDPCCASGGYGLGTGIALQGDTLVVGAGAPVGGAAHVYEKAAGSPWSSAAETARLATSSGIVNGFGLSLLLLGDTIIGGAEDEPVGGNPGQGAIYIFEKPAGGWITNLETAKVTASIGQAYDEFGSGLAADGDTLVVGAPHSDLSAINSGAVYVFDRPAGGSWTQIVEQSVVTASDADTHDFFGAKIALEGDTMAVSAPGADQGTWPGAGAVYVLQRPTGGSWSAAVQHSELTVANLTAWDALGTSVAMQGDHVFAGAPGAYNTGAAFAFHEAAVTPSSGCGMRGVALSGSTRIGGTLDMALDACAAGGNQEFVFGAPLAQPFVFPSALACSPVTSCQLSCSPLVRVPGSELVIPWANDPSFVGISLCVQGMCLQLATPCVELSDRVEITIRS